MSNAVVVQSNFSDPLKLHREALRLFEADLQNGRYVQALAGLSGFFHHVTDELWTKIQFAPTLKQAAENAFATRRGIQYAVREGLLPEEFVPTASSILPPLNKKELELIALPYRQLLSDAYQIAAGVHSGLRQYGQAASAYGLELEQLSAMRNREDPHIERMMKVFTQRTWALVQNLSFDAALTQLAVAAKVAKHNEFDVNEHEAFRRLSVQIEHQREYVRELKGITQRLNSLEVLASNRTIDADDVQTHASDMLRFMARAQLRGDVFPDVLAERLHLLKSAALYKIAKTDPSTRAESADYIAQARDAIHNPDNRNYLAAFLNSIRSFDSLERFDSTCYFYEPSRLRLSQKYVVEAALNAGADLASKLAALENFKEAAGVYKWMKAVLSSHRTRVTPGAVVIHLNKSEADFQFHDVSNAATEASTAQSLVEVLVEKKFPHMEHLNGHAFIRMGRCEHYRLCKVPELVESLCALPRNDRNQLWSIDVLPQLKKASLDTAWEVLYSLFQQGTGSDTPLFASGKGVAGLRLMFEGQELTDRLSAHFRHRAASFYYEAHKRLHADSSLREKIAAAKHGLANRETPTFTLDSLELPEDFAEFRHS